MQFGKALTEVKKLATGYYIGGIILSVAFFVLKITNVLCTFVFGVENECGLDRVSLFGNLSYFQNFFKANIPPISLMLSFSSHVRAGSIT